MAQNEAAKFLPSLDTLDNWSEFDDWMTQFDCDSDYSLSHGEFEDLYVKVMTKAFKVSRRCLDLQPGRITSACLFRTVKAWLRPTCCLLGLRWIY